MASIADACLSGSIPNAAVACVIGTASASPALERARSMGLETRVVRSSDPSFDSNLTHVLGEINPNLICLAGYMRLIPTDVLTHFNGRIVNIHPALLPSFGGKGMYGHHVHEAVIEHGCKVSGCTVHFVDEGFDTGPIILQKCVPVLDTDDADSLAERVLRAEHQAYPEAVGLIAQGKVTRQGRRIIIS
jgi:phosphoribosylglycinamide formyltransferase-1